MFTLPSERERHTRHTVCCGGNSAFLRPFAHLKGQLITLEHANSVGAIIHLNSAASETVFGQKADPEGPMELRRGGKFWA